MIKRNILIVDDEPTHCKLFSKFIENLGHNYFVVNNGLEVVDLFTNKKVIKDVSYRDIDVMLLDLSMPDIDGITLLKQISAFKGDVQVIVLTASNDISMAIKAINQGAIDYITKGDKDIFTRVTASINNAIEKKYLKYQVSLISHKSNVSFSDIIGQSEPMLSAIKAAKKASNSNISVLIEGPSGSGKKLLAMAIHNSSPRSDKSFITVDCSLLNDKNTEEELFGSEKPGPDGAVKKPGKLREANEGTIFFNKIDCLKQDLQAKLLDFMREGEFIPSGEKVPVKVNTRLIFSTSRNLERMVMTKKFREDFYYRLSAFSIKIPSLKDRGLEDLKRLAENFCHDFSINENRKIKGINPNAIDLLNNHGWEDNVRELKNNIFRAIILCDDEVLESQHFPNLLNKEDNDLTKTKSELKKKSDINSELIDIFDSDGKCKTIEFIEEEVIMRLVDVYNGNLSEVAKQLNMGRSTIYRKLKTLKNFDEHEES